MRSLNTHEMAFRNRLSLDDALIKHAKRSIELTPKSATKSSFVLVLVVVLERLSNPVHLVLDSGNDREKTGD